MIMKHILESFASPVAPHLKQALLEAAKSCKYFNFQKKKKRYVILISYYNLSFIFNIT